MQTGCPPKSAAKVAGRDQVGVVRKPRRPLLPHQKQYIDAFIFRNGQEGEPLGVYREGIAQALDVEHERISTYVGNKLNRLRSRRRAEAVRGN